jgi:hypothetical protein
VGPSTPAAGNEGGARPPARRAAHDRESTPAKSADPASTPAKATVDKAPLSAREFVNAPSNRTTIALPFSQIKLQEPSAELFELAGLLCELMEAIEEAVPKEQHDRLSDLHARAQTLRLRLR